MRKEAEKSWKHEGMFVGESEGKEKGGTNEPKYIEFMPFLSPSFLDCQLHCIENLIPRHGKF